MTDAGTTSANARGAGAPVRSNPGPPTSPAAPGSPWRSLVEPRFLAWAAVATLGSALAFGLVSAIIPNPVFGREIPPEPFAIVVWLASAPLMGAILATYLVPAPAVAVPLGPGLASSAEVASETPGSAAASAASASASAPVATPSAAASGRGAAPGAEPSEDRRSLLGYAGGLAAFLAIGCPVCNKIVLVALGTTGALTIWAPLQPVIGAASLLLLAGTLAWRLRVRVRGGACSVT